MKKFTALIIIIILGIAGYEYYTRYQPQIANITESIKSGNVVENINYRIKVTLILNRYSLIR